MKVVNQREEANPGSHKVTHKTMAIKSNTKGVSEVPTTMTPQIAELDGGARSTPTDLPKHNK